MSACRTGSVKAEIQTIYYGAVRLDCLQPQTVAVDAHAYCVVRGSGERGPLALARLVQVFATSSGHHVGHPSYLHRALIVVIVAVEDQVNAVTSENGF